MWPEGPLQALTTYYPQQQARQASKMPFDSQGKGSKYEAFIQAHSILPGKGGREKKKTSHTHI